MTAREHVGAFYYEMEAKKIMIKGDVFEFRSLLELFVHRVQNDTIDQVLDILNCGGTSCPKPCRAMCSEDDHKAIRALKTIPIDSKT